jgi:hypothetical protein
MRLALACYGVSHNLAHGLWQAARRVLTARYRLGMFQPPGSVPFASIGPEVVGSAEHKAAAVEAVEKGASLRHLALCDTFSGMAGLWCEKAGACDEFGGVLMSAGVVAGTVLLKNIASGSRARMLPLDKAGKQCIVVAGPMVRQWPCSCPVQYALDTESIVT